MVDLFKNWISVLLCLGIFITIIKLVIPKNNLRKYIYSLIGIITIIALISPVINIFKNGDMQESLKTVLSNFDEQDTSQVDTEKYNKVKENAVKESFTQSIKTDIKAKLEEKRIVVKKVEVFVSENYDIQKIEINIEKVNSDTADLSSVTQIVKYINEQYDIHYSKIEVIEEGA
ncbi:MAG: stage III sporulation protein AF [Clostridia bacterium]|nr:stage III sporulation protein AF [Clostridia bacterium]